MNVLLFEKIKNILDFFAQDFSFTLNTYTIILMGILFKSWHSFVYMQVRGDAIHQRSNVCDPAFKWCIVTIKLVYKSFISKVLSDAYEKADMVCIILKLCPFFTRMLPQLRLSSLYCMNQKSLGYLMSERALLYQQYRNSWWHVCFILIEREN